MASAAADALTTLSRVDDACGAPSPPRPGPGGGSLPGRSRAMRRATRAGHTEHEPGRRPRRRSEPVCAGYPYQPKRGSPPCRLWAGRDGSARRPCRPWPRARASRPAGVPIRQISSAASARDHASIMHFRRGDQTRPANVDPPARRHPPQVYRAGPRLRFRLQSVTPHHALHGSATLPPPVASHRGGPPHRSPRTRLDRHAVWRPVPVETGQDLQRQTAPRPRNPDFGSLLSEKGKGDDVAKSDLAGPGRGQRRGQLG